LRLLFPARTGLRRAAAHGGILLSGTWRAPAGGDLHRLSLFPLVPFKPADGHFRSLRGRREGLGRSLGPGARGDGARTWCWSGLLVACKPPFGDRITLTLNSLSHRALAGYDLRARLWDCTGPCAAHRYRQQHAQPDTKRGRCYLRPITPLLRAPPWAAARSNDQGSPSEDASRGISAHAYAGPSTVLCDRGSEVKAH
jgi:hypothetical protein